MTVCTDSPEDIDMGHSKHRLGAVMLSDRELSVTDAFGLRNLGFHSGPMGLEGLPVPTSLLIDGEGRVLWVDQSKDYQHRNGPAIVLAALERHLP